MFKRFLGLSIVAASLAISSSASASTTTALINQDSFTAGKGDITPHLFIDPVIRRGGFHSETFTFNVGANYFLTDILAPGLDFNVTAGGGSIFQFLPNIRAYLPTNQRYLPFAKVGIGYWHLPNVDDFNFSIGAGVDYLLSNTTAVGIQFNYDLGVGDVTLHQIQFPIQFALYFKL